jgi:signal transduction histidine kinase
LRYFGLNLSYPTGVVYRYKLGGSDKVWQEVGSRTEAVYTHLRPGEYVFQVEASNGDGIWTSPFNSAPFRILPAFYQTWWFEGLCVFAGILLLWLGITARVRFVAAGIRQRAEERADERIRIARELHDTLLQGVQGLLLSFHAAASKVPSDHESKKALERALATADRVILDGRDRVNRLRSEHLTNGELEPLIETIADDLTSLSKIDFALERTGTRQALNPEILDEIYYIVREALTNSFRHSGASQIVVALDYGKQQFSIVCRDNGRGFDVQELQESKAKGHWGLRGMAERAEKIGGDFDYRSAPAEGVQIRVLLPAIQAYIRPFGFKSIFHRRNAN